MSDKHTPGPMDAAKLMLDAKVVVEYYDRIIASIDPVTLARDGHEADFVITVEDYRALRDFALQALDTAPLRATELGGGHALKSESQADEQSPAAQLWERMKEDAAQAIRGQIVPSHQAGGDAIEAANYAFRCAAQIVDALPYPSDLPAAEQDWVRVPRELNDELRWILGRICFQCIHTAQSLRAMGHNIPRRAEDEQAAAIHWMLMLYAEHGDEWREIGTKILKDAMLATPDR